MKQAMKRFGAMLLTMAMLLSLAVTGVSAEDNPTGVNIKFEDLGKTDNVLDKVKAYQVIKYDDTENAFEDAGNVPEGKISFWSYLESENNKLDAAKKANAADYLATFKGPQQQDNLKSLLKRFLEGTVNSGNNALPSVTKTTDSEGVLKSVAPGYYILQIESSSKIYSTMLLFVGYEEGKLVVQMGGENLEPTGNTYTVKVKSEKGPTVEKYVFDDHDGQTELTTVKNWKKAAASEVGKKVDFAIKVKLPRYPNDADVTLILADTLKNLAYSAEDGVKVYYKNGDDYGEIENAAEFVTAADSSANPTTYANGEQTMNIALKYSVLKDKITAETEFYVHYKATLREDAVTDNAHSGTNNVTLNYTVKTSAGEYIGKPAAEEVTVYTYNFKLNKKYDGKDNSPSAPAEFSVYTGVTTNNAAVDTGKLVTFKKGTNADGSNYYYPDANGTVKEISADFEIRGLDVSTPYYVQEVETPAGYYAPSSYFTLQLSGKQVASSTVLNGDLVYDDDADFTQPSTFKAQAGQKDQLLVTKGRGDTTNGKYGEINDSVAYQYDVELNNTTTPVLPSTGGMGTTLFTVGGVALLALAAAMLILRRRKN